MPNAERVNIHVRLQRKNKKPTAFQLLWNIIDDESFNKAIITLPDQRAFDDIYVPDGKVEVFEVRKNIETSTLSNTFPVDDIAVSLKIIYDGVSARLYAGTKERTLIGIVPYDAANGGAVALDLNATMRAVRLTAEAESYPEPNLIAQEDLMPPSDVNPILGEWVYLDRDINQSLASLGGKYNLMIITNQNGCYNILISDGANVNKEEWSKQRIKGELTPSGFRGNYDLIWYDAMGRRLDDDNNAQLSDDGSVLTLYFPIYKSQLRFKKIK